jgi:5'-3' exonuclease
LLLSPYIPYNSCMNRLLLDGHNFARQIYYSYASQHDTRNADPAHAPREIIYGFLNMIAPLTRNRKGSLGPNHVIVALDSGRIEKNRYHAEGHSWRYDAYPNYKEGKRAVSDPQSRFGAQLSLLPEQLAAFGVQTVSIPGLEGDDIVTILSQNLPAGERATIVSRDKDVVPFVGPNVDYYNQGKDKDHVKLAQFGAYSNRIFKLKPGKELTPALWPLFRAFAGDTADNISGVEGCGDSTSFELTAALAGAGARIEGVRQDPADLLNEIRRVRSSLPKHAALLTDSHLQTLELCYRVMQPYQAPANLVKQAEALSWDMPARPTEAQVKAALESFGERQAPAEGFLFDHFIKQLPAWAEGLSEPKQPELSV